MTTVSALCRLSPRPAALMDSRKMNAELPASLNLRMARSLPRPQPLRQSSARPRAACLKIALFVEVESH